MHFYLEYELRRAKISKAFFNWTIECYVNTMCTKSFKMTSVWHLFLFIIIYLNVFSCVFSSMKNKATVKLIHWITVREDTYKMNEPDPCLPLILPPRYRLRDLILGDYAFNDDGERWVDLILYIVYIIYKLFKKFVFWQNLFFR